MKTMTENQIRAERIRQKLQKLTGHTSPELDRLVEEIFQLGRSDGMDGR